MSDSPSVSAKQARSTVRLRGRTGTELPGFVDIQLNGGFGYDFTTNAHSIWEVGSLLPRLGVTAFVPTLISAPAEVAIAAMKLLRAGPPDGWVGSLPIGIHLEGPMISPRRRGTHPVELLQDPTQELVERLIDAGPPLMVTIAPELAGAEEAIRQLTEMGTIISIGHSDATSTQAEAAVKWGARHATHLFNAMSGLDHRNPGMASTILTDDRLTTGLISDGVHVASEMLALAYRMKGSEGIALVTDAIAALGLDDGPHSIGPVDVTVSGITARNAEGVLAGSAASMCHVFRTMLTATGCSLADASTMASSTPSRIVGHQPDQDDLVILDSDLEVAATVIGGQVMYDRDA